MPRYNYDALKQRRVWSKTSDVLPALSRVAADPQAMRRVAAMASAFSARFSVANAATPAIDGVSTNPFVLAAYAQRAGLTSPYQIDAALVGAKMFSSLETASGRIVEDIVPGMYGWSQVPSAAHSVLTEVDSADARASGLVRLIALKSGPACINDTMAKRIGNAVAEHLLAWAAHWGVTSVEFTVGMNYSTPSNSNHKDYQAVRLAEVGLRAAGATINRSCEAPPLAGQKRPVALAGGLQATLNGVTLTMRERQGIDLWDYVATPTPDVVMEISCALAKAAAPSAVLAPAPALTTSGLVAAVAPGGLRPPPALLTDAQLPWLFLFLRHYVDELTP